MSSNDLEYWYWDTTTEKANGPHSVRALLVLVAAKAIGPETLVATPGQTNWVKLCDSIDLSGIISAPRGEGKLTKIILEALIKTGLKNDELRRFSSIDEDAASLLCTVLDCDADLDLSGLTSLTPNIAMTIILNPYNYLDLSGLTKISDDTAWELSQFLGEDLDLSGIKELSFRSWCYLSNSLGDIDFGEAEGCPNWLDPVVQIKCNMILAEKGY